MCSIYVQTAARVLRFVCVPYMCEDGGACACCILCVFHICEDGGACVACCVFHICEDGVCVAFCVCSMYVQTAARVC